MSRRLILLLAVTLFSGSAVVVHDSWSPALAAPEPQRCPAWFDDSPEVGPGRPEALQLEGLVEVTVCRYLHAFGGYEVVHDPPLQSDLASEVTLSGIAGARSLARSIDGLEPFRHPRIEQQHCGVPVGGGFYLLFIYRDSHRESVKLVVAGCRYARAGKHGNLLHVSNEFRRRLGDLAPLAEESADQGD